MTFTETEIIDGAKSIGVDGAAVINAILELQRVRGSSVEAVQAEILGMLQMNQRGDYVAAVKRTRERLGYGLRQAVDFVNAVKQANGIA